MVLQVSDLPDNQSILFSLIIKNAKAMTEIYFTFDQKLNSEIVNIFQSNPVLIKNIFKLCCILN
jgi:hypothetical protein